LIKKKNFTIFVCSGRQLLDVQFTTPFLKHLINEPIEAGDLASIDPQLHKNITWILENSANGMDLSFSVSRDEFGHQVTHELKSGGSDIEVDDSNKDEYAALYCSFMMTHPIAQQIFSFKQGFYEFVPVRLARMFCASELQLLISGLPQVR
jgi:hypothetical protein